MFASSPDSDLPHRQHLGDSLGLILPGLAPELVPSESRSWLTTVAGVLPPIHRAGFECRLADGDDDVDLQLGVWASEEEPARLARFLRAQEPLTAPWERVGQLAERWAQPTDPFRDGIVEVWLELDADPVRMVEPLSLAGLAPSVFAVLSAVGAETSLALAGDVVRVLAEPETSVSLVASLRRFADACPPPARISHVGLMLGRPIAAMRVHLSPVPLAAVHRLVEAIGWPGDSAQVQSLAETLLDYGDLMVLCFDVVADHVVRIGLECFFAETHGLDPRWPPLLQRLTQQGYSSADKAGALLRWPSTLTPLSITGDWPQNLIVQSLRNPPDTLGVLDRRNSHVKLTCLPDGTVTAKAYFGYGHVWLSDPRSSRPDQPPPATRPAASAQEALERGVDRLLAARTQGGWWRDFFDRGRPANAERRATDASDEWVTAFVACALASVPTRNAQDAARDALGLLLRRHDGSAGWGFHALLPADADTTTWVLRLATALDVPDDARLAAGRQLVAALTRADGTVCTYPPAAGAQLARFLNVESSFAGWCGAHLCVTAAVAAMQGQSRPLAALRDTQQPDGSWQGHWWHDDEYTTARAVEALARQPGHAEQVAAAVWWSAGRIGSDGAVHSIAHGGPSAFATALALHSIRIAFAEHPGPEVRAAAAAAERWLVAHQLDDGSWHPSAELRMPAPDAIDPLESPELAVTYLDERWAISSRGSSPASGSSSARRSISVGSSRAAAMNRSAVETPDPGVALIEPAIRLDRTLAPWRTSGGS
jgi:hypothetical protein